jgi:hypothetical protein
VLDVSCGRGLLLVGAARHLTTGKATGVDRLDDWGGQRRPATAGPRQRVCSTGQSRARRSAVPAVRKGAFDVVLSSFAVHEMDTFAVGSAHGGDRHHPPRTLGRHSLELTAPDITHSRPSRNPRHGAPRTG